MSLKDYKKYIRPSYLWASAMDIVVYGDELIQNYNMVALCTTVS